MKTQSIAIHESIQGWFGDVAGEPHARYRSWEHCYSFFQTTGPAAIAGARDFASLQLAFFLASWGMYRGSSFLLQHAYTIHRSVVDVLTEPRFAVLWQREFGANDADIQLIAIVLQATEAIRTAYEPFGYPSDTLVTKILMGTLGCLPACDRYFRSGFKRSGFQYSGVNRRFVERVFRFCRHNLRALRKEQAAIERISGVHYPLMKLVDMHFSHLGY